MMESEGKMTTTDAIGWINALIKAMHEETSGTWPDPKYKDEVYSALEMAIQALSQEPCDDAISREAVMDCYKKWRPYMATRMWGFEKELSELPSVTQKSGKWIPVNERLPEDAQEVLYSTKTGCVFHGEYYDDNTDRKWFSYKDDIFSFNNVVNAWMPLPKPYEPQESEKVNCKSTKCENCTNHNYCDYEPQESEE